VHRDIAPTDGCDGQAVQHAEEKKLAGATEFVVKDFDSARSGDAVLVPRVGVMTHWDPARGSMHGTQYDYDTHVPLLFWGPGFRAETDARATTPYDLAPTLAALLGVELKDAVGHSRLD